MSTTDLPSLPTKPRRSLRRASPGVPTGDWFGSLTYPQQCVVRKLRERPWQTAWELNYPIATLKALEKRGIVERKQVEGRRRFFENDDYHWALKPNDERTRGGNKD